MTKRRQFGRIRKLPSGRWQARYPDTLGRDVAAPKTFATKTEATSFLAKVQADQERGDWRNPRAGQVLFKDWVKEWLDSNPGKRATTRARDETVLRKHFVPPLGDRPLGTITPAHVRAAFDVMAAKVATATARTNLGVLKAVMNAAVEADLIVRSPVRGIRLRAGEPRRRPTLTPDELMRLAGALPERYRALILLGGVLGLRWSEAIALRVGDVDFLRRTLTISQTISEVEGVLEVAPTKSTASRRTLSVPSFLLDELAEHVATYLPDARSDVLLFSGPTGAPLRRTFAARVFTPAVAEAKLDPAVTFHGLRHVATSLMVEAGEHPRVIQHRLGHATARLSMELYAHVPDAADRDVAARLDARFRKPAADDARENAR